MSLAKARRKIKRAGKSAVQFRITSTFEFIELECKGSWRPEKLSVVWQRSHRKVKSNEATWTVSDDFGPNGAKGRGVFTPAIAVSLVVTLYRDAQHTEFDEKEYKYYIQNDGPSGKKILASFNCNVADFVGIPSTKHALDLNFKCVSKKVGMAKLGITLESQFMKEGGAMDDDMQSTFSAISTGQESVTYEEEDEEEEEGEEQVEGAAGRPQPSQSSPRETIGSRRLGTLLEETEDSVTSSVEKSLVLGTGEHIQRQTLSPSAPAKPPRPRSVSPIGDLPLEPELNSEPRVNSEPDMNSEPKSNSNMTSGPNTHQVSATNSKPDMNSEPAGNQGNSKATGVQQLSPLPEISVSKFDKPLEVAEKEKPVANGPVPVQPVQQAAPVPAVVVQQEAPAPVSVQPVQQEISKPAMVEKEKPAAKGPVSVQPVNPAPAVVEKEKPVANGPVPVQPVQQEAPKPAVEKSVAKGPASVQSVTPAPAVVEKEKPAANGPVPVQPVPEEAPKPAVEKRAVAGEINSASKHGSSRTVNATEKSSTVSADGVDAYSRVANGRGHEQAASGLAGTVVKETEKKNISPNRGRKTVESIETYTPPANPFDEMAEDEEAEEATPHPSHTEVWLEREAKLVDCFGEVVSREKLEQADLIGLYFSAGWCPPCRRFLPKLVKFYHHLKQHGKAFEILYISSDYSKQDMMKYMKEQQMPWVGICYEGSVSEDFRKKYGVSAVPLFKILGRRGDTIEDSAKRSVEGATSGAAILKLYNKWHEKMMMGESNGRGGGGEEEVRVATASNQRKGILSKVKASIQKTPKDSEQQISDISSLSSSPPRSPESGRRVLDTRVNRKSKGSKGTVSAELLEEKEERIQHLEEVNRTLKQTNDELTEELGELRQKYEAITAELEHIKSTSKTLQDESKELIANLNMRGWLYKRGVRGPTASIWRRRYFRLDQGSKLYYYKNSSEGNPQGFIDMDKVIGVQEVTASQQDKNHATFTVQCEGRTFQLQAHDEPSMRKWMEAILYMTNWRKKNSTVSVDDL